MRIAHILMELDTREVRFPGIKDGETQKAYKARMKDEADKKADKKEYDKKKYDDDTNTTTAKAQLNNLGKKIDFDGKDVGFWVAIGTNTELVSNLDVTSIVSNNSYIVLSQSVATELTNLKSSQEAAEDTIKEFYGTLSKTAVTTWMKTKYKSIKNFEDFTSLSIDKMNSLIKAYYSHLVSQTDKLVEVRLEGETRIQMMARVAAEREENRKKPISDYVKDVKVKSKYSNRDAKKASSIMIKAYGLYKKPYFKIEAKNQTVNIVRIFDTDIFKKAKEAYKEYREEAVETMKAGKNKSKGGKDVPTKRRLNTLAKANESVHLRLSDII